MPTKQTIKTSYCKHHRDCDRPENCFKGKFCPFFETNPDIAEKQSEIDDTTSEDAFKDIIDGVWGGEKEVRR